MRSSSEGCKCCLLALQCEGLCVWSIPGRLCGPDWQTGQRWVTAYHKGKTSLCVGCTASSSLYGCIHVHTRVWGPAENMFTFFTFGTRLSRRSTSPLHQPSTFRRGRGVSVRSEWHTCNPSADVIVSELGETRAAGWVCGQGPSFRDATGQSFSMHFSLLHFVSST